MINYSRILIQDVFNTAQRILSKYPEYWRTRTIPMLPRICEEVSWIYHNNGSVVDLGEGHGFHAAICSQLGMNVICVDKYKVQKYDHLKDGFYQKWVVAEKIASDFGVNFVHSDMLSWVPRFEHEIDVIISFDAIEHLHHSHRNLFKILIKSLKKEGLLVIGIPKAANIFKRLRVLIGKNIFSSFEEWYYSEYFGGHVREPTVKDLNSIGNDLNLIRIIGRNWICLNKYKLKYKKFTNIADNILRLFPTFCSDIYLLAKKVI